MMNIYMKKLSQYDLPIYMNNLFSNAVIVQKVEMFRDSYSNIYYMVVYEHNYEVF